MSTSGSALPKLREGFVSRCVGNAAFMLLPTADGLAELSKRATLSHTGDQRIQYSDVAFGFAHQMLLHKPASGRDDDQDCAWFCLNSRHRTENGEE
jgi:hypothetical protein